MISHLDCLYALKKWLFAEAAQLYPNVGPTLEVPISESLVEPAIVVKCSQGTKVSQLLHAESRLAGDGSVFVALALPNQFLLSGDAVLDGSPIWIRPAWTPSIPVDTQPAVPLHNEPVPLHNEPGYEMDTMISATALDADPDDNPSDVCLEVATADMLEEPTALNQNETALLQIIRLPSDQLLQVVPPLVFEASFADHFRQQLVSSDVRLSLLVQQDNLWANDEVVWHLSKCALHESLGHVAFLDPLLIRGFALISNTLNPLTLPAHITCVVSAVCLLGHWTPCVWIKKNEAVVVHIWEQDGFDLEDLNQLHSVICKAFAAPHFTLMCQRRSFGNGLCGAATISFVRAMLAHHDMPITDDELLQLHLIFPFGFKTLDVGRRAQGC